MGQKETEKVPEPGRPLLTVVVPVYQTKKYLCRCVYSLIRQTYGNLEILLIDDGSTDGSGELCEQLRTEDERIRVIHQKNGGLSCARNTGLREAGGTYIGFVDSDDAVEETMFEELIRAAQMSRADIVMCDYKRIFRDGRTENRTTSLEAGVYDKLAIQKYLYPSLLMGKDLNYGPLLQVWNCIYRKAFLERWRIMFEPEIKWSEDNLFNARAGCHAKCFVYLKGRMLYQYFQNEGSITNAYRPGAWEIYKKMNVCMTRYFRDQASYDFSSQLNWHLLYYACNVIGMECTQARTLREACDRIKPILAERCLRTALRETSDRMYGCHGQEKLKISGKLKIQLLLMKYQIRWLLAIGMRRCTYDRTSDGFDHPSGI